MSGDVQSFAVETLAWTGALIALVLVLRRPVTRHFGANSAYALWLLPFLRLMLPPIALPAWLAPAPAAEPLPVVAPYVLAEAGAEPVIVQPLMKATVSIDWLAIALAAWLAGALVFLAVRFLRYFAMRRDLLAGGVEVGRCGKVRLVETPVASSPIAFGVIDKVIALPEGFMAQTEPTRRDLALAHELAHHKAHDLLANVLVQPLFAIHWFNPLGWIGWRAMRCDQEAACDARVVAQCGDDLRGTYAAIIAAFATGTPNPSRVALAAPMACPVLGDKSIIHRLRSLTMSDISPRRRLAARTLMIGALVALPLTASITQAEALAPPAAPGAPAPAAPLAPPAPPAAPGAPSAPDAPEAADASHVILVQDGEDGEGKRTVRIERKVVRDGDGEPRETSSYFINGREATAEERAKLEAELKEVERMARDGEKDIRKEVRILRERLGEGGEIHADLEVLRDHFSENGEFAKEMRVLLERSKADMPRIVMDCDGSGELFKERTGPDGEKIMVVCESTAFASATSALTSARSAIANARRAVERDPNLSERERSEALRSLDRALKEVRREQ